MKRLYLLGLLILALSACKRNAPAEPEPEFKPRETEDWLILTAPEEREVWGVFGNIDSTLLITTGYKIYYTQDRGNSWQESDYKPGSGVFGITSLADTLYALTTQRGYPVNGISYAINPQFQSIDGGKTWIPSFNRRAYESIALPRNQTQTANGLIYSIDQELTAVCTSCSNYYLETPGFKTPQGRKVLLPEQHQLQSIYLDSQQRLYLSGSAAVCGGVGNMSFCKGHRGVIYISKKALPK